LTSPRPSHTIADEASTLNFKIEFDRETDGRWIAEIAELPGVLAYGATKDEAEAALEGLALCVIAQQRA
jgi:predicted RNase H-like HicB family nuclease